MNKNLSPILLSSVAKEIREVNGSIWHIGSDASGTIFRASIFGKNIRVVVPALSKNVPEPPEEKGSLLHIVTDLKSLQSWLQNF